MRVGIELLAGRREPRRARAHRARHRRARRPDRRDPADQPPRRFARVERREDVDLLALAAEEGARVAADVGGSAVTVRGDARLLRRLVRNLFENARRYGGGAAIEAESSAATAEARSARQRPRPRHPAEERERVFEPFYRRPAHQRGRRRRRRPRARAGAADRAAPRRRCALPAERRRRRVLRRDARASGAEVERARIESIEQLDRRGFERFAQHRGDSLRRRCRRCARARWHRTRRGAVRGPRRPPPSRTPGTPTRASRRGRGRSAPPRGSAAAPRRRGRSAPRRSSARAASVWPRTRLKPRARPAPPSAPSSPPASRPAPNVMPPAARSAARPVSAPETMPPISAALPSPTGASTSKSAAMRSSTSAPRGLRGRAARPDGWCFRACRASSRSASARIARSLRRIGGGRRQPDAPCRLRAARAHALRRRALRGRPRHATSARGERCHRGLEGLHAPRLPRGRQPRERFAARRLRAAAPTSRQSTSSCTQQRANASSGSTARTKRRWPTARAPARDVGLLRFARRAARPIWLSSTIDRLADPFENPHLRLDVARVGRSPRPR